MNNCITISIDPLIVKKEHGRKVVLSNPSRKEIEIGIVDGCLINVGVAKKCDFYFQISEELIYYIELKGCDIKKAISQIISTVSYLAGKRAIPQKIGLIVCSRVPRFDVEYQKTILKNRKKLSKLGLKFLPPSCVIGKLCA